MTSLTPVRVATVVGKWHGYGVETLLSELAVRIDPKRVRLEFVVDSDSRAVPFELIRGMGHDVIEVAPYQRLPHHLRDLGRLFRNRRYDVVHAHTSSLASIPLAVAHSARVPIRISHVHTTASKSEFTKSAVKLALKPLSGVFATHLGMSSREAGRWMFGERALRRRPTIYLPVARDLNRFAYDPCTRSRIRKELGISDRVVIGHFGRFVPQKNHEFLLKVFAQVHRAEPRAMLLLAGDGPLMDAVQRQARSLRIAESVLILGRRDDVHELYQALDVFALPSLYEGVPGTGIEAQASGLPFVFSTSISDEVQLAPNAFRISLDDEEKWARAILRSASEGRSPAALGVLRDAGYDLDSAARSLTSFYERVAPHRR